MVSAASRSLGLRTRNKMRDMMMPASKRIHMGKAMALCDTASGGVRMAAMMKMISFTHPTTRMFSKIMTAS